LKNNYIIFAKIIQKLSEGKMCKEKITEPFWLCPIIFFIVFICVISGIGALIGVLMSQSETCCLAVKACWNKQSGTITIGPCAGPLNCAKIIDYSDKCTAQQQPIILYYTGLGAAFAVGIILVAFLICFIGSLFITDSRNKMLALVKNCCTGCKRKDYEILPQ